MPITNVSNALRRPQVHEYIRDNAVMLNENKTIDYAVNGATYEITLASSSFVKVIEISADAFKANGYTARMKFAYRTTGDNTSIRHSGTAEITWAWNNIEFIINNNCPSTGANSGIYSMRVLAPIFTATNNVYAPKSTSYAGCTVSWRAYNTTSRKIELTILESDVPYTVNISPATADGYASTYQTVAEMTIGNTNSHFNSNSWSGSVNGGAGNSWDTLYNDRYCLGEAFVYGSLMGVASDGKLWKLRNTAKEFPLPLIGGLGPTAYGVGSTYVKLALTQRGLALSVFTTASMQTTAFTVANISSSGSATTAWTIGDPVFLQGTLNSNGNWVSTGVVTNTMSPGYTYIKIGKVDWYNDNTNYSAQGWTVQMQYMTAYTLNSSGVITHIDGKQVNDTTYSTATTSSNGLMSSSDKSKLDGIYANATNVTYTNKVTDGSVIGTININGVANNVYSPTNNLKSESHILYCWEE